MGSITKQEFKEEIRQLALKYLPSDKYTNFAKKVLEIPEKSRLPEMSPMYIELLESMERVLKNYSKISEKESRNIETLASS
ncbi:MAG: hypothetical protein AB1393_11855 [Candidatus Edwardsbacteria bacterium]